MNLRVLVAGQTPPPVCGQNLNIQRVLKLLGGMGGITAEHWAFRFTPEWSSVRRTGFGKGIELIRVWGRLLRLRVRGCIDVVLYPVGGPHTVPLIRDLLLLPAACLCAKRVVLHFRAAGLAEALPQMNPLLRAAIRRVYRRCGHAIVLTEFGRRDPEAAGLLSDRIRVVPNACEDRCRQGWERKKRAGDAVTIFHAGLLCPDKGTPELLKGFAAMAARRSDVRLKLAGEPMGGLSRDSLREMVAELGCEDRIEWCGVLGIEELDREFAEADLFVFPTVAPFESFGMVLIEAMMWSLPIVASDWRGNREVLGHDGSANVVFDVASGSRAENLEKALELAIRSENRWVEWGQQNRRRFLHHFEIERLKRNFESYLRPPSSGA